MSSFKSVARYSFGFALTAVFMYFAFRGIDPGALWESLSHISWIWIVLLFVGGVLSHLARAWRWQYLLLPVKNKISLRNSFAAVMVGYLVNNGLPRVGEVVRPYMLGKTEHVSKSAAFGSVVLERILDITTFLFLLLVVLFLYSSSFAELFPSFADVQFIFSIGSVLAFILFIVLFLKAGTFLTYFKKASFLFPRKLWEKIAKLYDSFVEGFAVAKHPKEFFAIAFSSVVIWGLYTLLMYIPFFSYDTMIAHHLNFGSATVLMVVSSVAFALPAPGGFGTYHSFTTFALVHLYHIDWTTALSYSILTHTVGIMATTSFGLYYFIKDQVHISDAVKDGKEKK
jgi:glycosyltransferase 2 family protein